jgi:hypothetical protein
MTATAWRTTGVALLLGLGAMACGSYDKRPAEWEYISPVVLAPNCATASCHSRAAAVSGLDFSDSERGYISLTRLRYQIVDRYAMGENCTPQNETVVCRGSYRPLVMPYNPSQSRLVHLLRHRTPPRMPPDRPLLEADIRLIEGWILLGAPRHRNGPAAEGVGDGGRDASGLDGSLPATDGPSGDGAAAPGDAARDLGSDAREDVIPPPTSLGTGERG